MTVPERMKESQSQQKSTEKPDPRKYTKEMGNTVVNAARAGTHLS